MWDDSTHTALKSINYIKGSMKHLVYALALAGFATFANAQDQGQQAIDIAKPTTKNEAFSAKTGVVMIKGMSTIGTIGGIGKLVIDVREFRDASAPKSAQYGLAMEVKESGRLERENRSFIDEDEIESLIRGLEYISKIDSSVTSLSGFEAQYRTKGDFSITTYSDRSGGIGLAVSSGRIGKTTAFLKLSDAEVIKSHLIAAQKVIASAKQR